VQAYPTEHSFEMVPIPLLLKKVNQRMQREFYLGKIYCYAFSVTAWSFSAFMLQN
jgi:hypothetical protein